MNPDDLLDKIKNSIACADPHRTIALNPAYGQELVDEIERLRARVAELEAEVASDKQARCPRDFDAVPRDYTGNADDMIAELKARP